MKTNETRKTKKEFYKVLYACNSALAAVRTDEFRRKVEELETLLMEQERKYKQ